MSARARPILFSALMVRALIEGRKTQTRRVVKPQPLEGTDALRDIPGENRWWAAYATHDAHGVTYRPLGSDEQHSWRCPYGKPGDLLWVRETWQHAPQKYCRCPQSSEASPCDAWSEGTGCISNRGDVVYAADGSSAPHWRPPIFMPRWASRLTLRITDVRVQQLQEISDADAIAEGWPYEEVRDVRLCDAYPVGWYSHLWESIHGPGSWSENPWVWRIAFDVIKAEADEVAE